MKLLIVIIFAFLVSIILTIYPGTVTIQWLNFEKVYPIGLFGLVIFCTSFFILLISKFFKLFKKAKFYFKNRKEHLTNKFQEQCLFDAIVLFEKNNFNSAYQKLNKVEFCKKKYEISNYILGNICFLEKRYNDARLHFSNIDNAFLKTKGLVKVSISEKEYLRAYNLIKNTKDSAWALKIIKWLRFNLLKTAKIDLEPINCQRQLAIEEFLKKGDLKFAFEKTKNIPKIAIDYAKTQNIEVATKTIFEAFINMPHRSLIHYYLNDLIKDSNATDVYKKLMDLFNKEIIKKFYETRFCTNYASKYFGFKINDIENENFNWKCSTCNMIYNDFEPYCNYCFSTDCFVWNKD